MRISFLLTLACVFLAPQASQACDRTPTVMFAGEPCHNVGGSLVSIHSGRTLAFVDTRSTFLDVRSAHFRAPVFVPVQPVGRGPVVQQHFRRALLPGNRLKSQTVR